MEQPTLLNTNEVAKLLNVKSTWIRSAVFRKKIPYIKVGRLLRFRQSEILKWLELGNNKVESQENTLRKRFIKHVLYKYFLHVILKSTLNHGGFMKSQSMAQNWREIFKKQKESNLSIAEFCRLNNLAQSRYFYWRKQLNKKSISKRDERSSLKNDFICLSKDADKKGQEVTFTIGEHKITFSNLPDPKWIAKLTKELYSEHSSAKTL